MLLRSNIGLISAPQIRRTQKAIKTALTERWYAWEDARVIAERDPEVDLHTNLETPAYKPRDLFAVSIPLMVCVLPYAEINRSLRPLPLRGRRTTRLRLKGKHRTSASQVTELDQCFDDLCRLSSPLCMAFSGNLRGGFFKDIEYIRAEQPQCCRLRISGMQDQKLSVTRGASPKAHIIYLLFRSETLYKYNQRQPVQIVPFASGIILVAELEILQLRPAIVTAFDSIPLSIPISKSPRKRFATHCNAIPR